MAALSRAMVELESREEGVVRRGSNTMSSTPIELRGSRRTTVRHPRMARKHEVQARMPLAGFADTLTRAS